MQAIIVAAGMGRRLAPHTDDRPKSLVEVGGRSILQRQLDAYRASGVTDVAIVRGYMRDRLAAALDGSGARFFENEDFRNNNILASLFCAEPAMERGFLFSYSDIVFVPSVVEKVVASEADYALVIDRRWADAYVDRTMHPESEAELAKVDSDGRVLRVGKTLVARDEAYGEFIGLAKFSARAARRMREEYRRLEKELGADQPFGNAKRFAVAYLTDLLNHLIDAGERMQSVDIDGGWREIDTPQDLERARLLFK